METMVRRVHVGAVMSVGQPTLGRQERLRSGLLGAGGGEDHTSDGRRAKTK